MNVYTEGYDLRNGDIIRKNDYEMDNYKIVKELNRMTRELHNRECDEIGDEDNRIECDCGKSKKWDVAGYCSNCGGVVYGVFMLGGYE